MNREIVVIKKELIMVKILNFKYLPLRYLRIICMDIQKHIVAPIESTLTISKVNKPAKNIPN